MKTALIVVGIILLIPMVVFLYLLISGADESRRHDRYQRRNQHDQQELRKDD